MSAPEAISTSAFARLERAVAARFGLGLAAVFFLAFSLRLAYLNQMAQGIYFNILKMEGTDSFIFWKWALEIVERDPLGHGVFNQSPLYPYYLALVFKLFGPNMYAPRFIQIVLGAGSCVLAGWLGRRAGGAIAGWLAALLAAAYGPLILYDAAVLRDGMLAFLNTLLVVLIFRAWKKPGAANGGLLGVVYGLAILGKPNPLVLLPALAAGGYGLARRHGRRQAAVTLGALALGWGLVFLPVFARNLAVGVPLWAFDQRGPLEFISGNVPQSPGVGWVIPPGAEALVEKNHGSLPRVIVDVLKINRPHPLGLVRQQMTKLGAWLSAYEVPNNLSYYVERRYVPLLQYPWLDWSTALSLGALGMLAAWRRRRELWPLYAYVVLFSLGSVAFYVIDRFRIPLVPCMLAFAGVGGSLVIRMVLEKKIGSALALAATILVLAIVSRSNRPDLLQAADYQNMARYHLISGEPNQARQVLDEGIARTQAIVAGGRDREEYQQRLVFLRDYRQALEAAIASGSR